MFGIESNLLTMIVFFPLFWGALGLLIPKKLLSQETKLMPKKLCGWSLLGTLLTFALCIPLYTGYLSSKGSFQFLEKYVWFKDLGIHYALGIDGVSLWLILLTTFLSPIVVLSSYACIQEKMRLYYFILLFLETTMLGAFTAIDLFLFYVFWEVMLIPMFFLIGIWGGKERIAASMKFFIYTIAGSLIMLVAIFYLAAQHKLQFGYYSTLLIDLYPLKIIGGGDFWTPQNLAFLAFALAFSIKVPLFPLHTWLPDAHVQAPTGGSVILAGILLKMGGYGFFRFAFPLFPEAVVYFQFFFMTLATIAIIYGACIASVQTDIKKLVAYSSVSHMGYIILGLFSLTKEGIIGSLYQMLSHGISTGSLFLLVGAVYERGHTREIALLSGISKIMPLFATTFMIVVFSSLALPGTNGFIGEFLILLATWKVSPLLAAISGMGIILGPVYLLWMFQRVMFGPLRTPESKVFKDLCLREKIFFAPLLFLIFFMGVFPHFFFSKMNTSIDLWMAQNHFVLGSVQPLATGFSKEEIR